MQWLNELPFGDYRVVQIGFLLACAIAALVVLAIAYRLVFAHRLRVPGARTRQPRLGLVDAFSLDGQRQLVLVRRDNIEHLVMIGGPNDVLIESQINRALPQTRDNAHAAPAQTPAAPVRRTEPVAVAPAPPAAPAPAPPVKVASPPAPPPSPSPLPAEARAVSPQASATASHPASPSTAPAPAPASQPRQPTGPMAGPASPPGGAKPEPGPPAREAPAPPRPTPARAPMPPPITPAGGPGRANLARTADEASRGPSSGSPARARPPDAAAAAFPNQRKIEPAVAAPRPETRSTPGGATAPAPAGAKPEPPPSGAESRGTDASTRPQGTGQAAPDKASAKPNDPFSGLDSLEEEMARLLGRDKPG